MLEVAFSDSVKGSLKAAKNYNRNENLAVSIGIIGSAPPAAVIEKMCRGQALPGTSQEVIGFTFNLDIGDISGEVDSEARRNFIFTMLGGSFPSEEESIKMQEQWWENSYLNDLHRLKNSAENGEAIRLWWSDAPAEACGFYAINSLLQDCRGKVSGIKLPRYVTDSANAVCRYSSWGEVMPGEFYCFLPLETEITPAERRAIAMDWQKLKRQNAPLRAVVNGKLMSVPEDFYDHLIRAHIPPGEFKLAKLIGTIMNENRIGVSDWWYAQRIKKMVEAKELEIISDNEFDYEKMLRKV